MYLLACYAGYPIPVKAGSFDICQIKATIRDTTGDARLILIDDLGIGPDDKNGRILPSSSKQVTKICDEKRSGNIDSQMEIYFYEPVKTK